MLNDKMLEWIENGCLLEWLVMPVEEKVYIYCKNGTSYIVEGFDSSVSGENILPGFELQLSLLSV